MKISVFILSAGFGERLKPITNYIPKPLLPILGKPILQIVLEKVSKINPDKIIINLHYKKDLIEKWLKDTPFKEKLIVLHEEKILGTGGALKNAEHFLKNNTFIVYNSDILTDLNLEKFINYHTSSKNLATLVVHNYPEFNTLEIDDKGLLKGIKKNANKNIFAFTGISIYEPDFLKILPYGHSNIVNSWVKAINNGIKIGTFDITGTYWTDIGTPVAYFKSVIDQLKKDGETIYIHPTIDWCKNIEFDGFTIIEKNAKKISKDKLKIKNCIILPDSCLKNSIYENCITFSNTKLQINKKDLLEYGEKDDCFLIGTGGSDRKYYRIINDKKTYIFMQSSKNDPDFQRHIKYTIFFKKYHVPTPELIKVEPENKRAYFEDLGDITLYSWLKCPRSIIEIEKMYKKVIDILILLHTVVTEHVNECPLLKNRIFDYEYFRWETNYFIENFVKSISKINYDENKLNEEFHKLALKADSFPKTVIHRDFQSQNIMIKNNNIPYIIDYQGARIGPPAYDVVSLLWDPYFHIKSDIRKKLLQFYTKKMKEATDWFKINEFKKSLITCRLQRHMQALGAYSFLSNKKGRKHFKKFILEGINLLRYDVYLVKNKYPELFKLALKIFQSTCKNLEFY